MRHVVIAGNGMVGHRLCERLRELAPGPELAITVLGEEPRVAYDRVHLSEFFSGRASEDLALADAAWYAERGVELRLGERVTRILRSEKRVNTGSGHQLPYDQLVLATGSAPFVPPLPGIHAAGVFVYRTIEDLEAIRAWADGLPRPARAAVLGGGLLGLEAAKAAHDLGLETHVVEMADRLMPRQVDAAGGAVLRQAIEALGVQVHLDARTRQVRHHGRVEALEFEDGEEIAVDMIIVSAGIRPRDELAREAGLEVGERGGITVDDGLATSDADVFALGEAALHEGSIYGLVGPGYEMADVLARRLTGDSEARFTGADLSTKLKLMGVDVASFGDAFADQARPDEVRSVVLEDSTRGVYQKLLVDRADKRLLGGVLVGDADSYMALQRAVKDAVPLPDPPTQLLLGAGAGGEDVASLEDDSQVCSCNNVSAGQVREAIGQEELCSVAEVKACTRAGTGCGGCTPLVAKLFEAELARAGREVDRSLCEHFPYTRQELFWIVKLGRIESFDAVLDSHGSGDGCEVCRPAVASILASTWNDLVVRHAEIQDTNDRFLANIQRGGSYSVVPRVPAGEITPDKLIVLGEVARKHDLYCKITGGQRIDLFGARVEQLPAIWEELVAAGFESGHAYGKAMRTVKSCIGSTWCRFGVQDSTAFAIRVEERYRGIRAPHKLKSAVSGCIRECAEAQNKDFGIIATENGWNLYLCGNGGSNPRHGDLVAADVDSDTVIRLVDRFLMFYIQTAKPLQRTARWLEELEGGIETLKSVILDDSLGICEQLEADMEELVGTYRCEWKEVVESPELRRRFRHFAGSDEPDPSLAFVRERGQRRPADWAGPAVGPESLDLPPEELWSWVRAGSVEEFPENGGSAIRHGEAQIAVFRFARRHEWYATENRCPHRRDNVLARGLLGSEGGEPKVACPFHKKTFSLATGKGLSDPAYSVRAFPVEVREGSVFVKLPPTGSLEGASGTGGCGGACA